MKICLVGGIYGKKRVFRETFLMTPETILEKGLIRDGHHVETFGHYDQISFDRFDIVHVHHFALGALRVASDHGNVSFVYTSHDGPSLCGNPGSVYRRLGGDYVMARADAVVALSEVEARFQKSFYNLSGALHRVIPNGIDLECYRYSRKNRRGRGRPWRLLFVGQLIKLKNVDILLEAASKVPFPLEIELIYHVNTLELELSSLTLELGMRERVLFTGVLPPEEVCRKYQAADLFVLPSSAEALPSVVMEAMICGTPVVATSVGGIPDQVGSYGILVPPRSVEKLTEAITTLIRNYDQYERMGQEMSSTIQERFSTERMIREHVSLYGELAEGAKHRERRRDVPGRIIGLGAKWLCRMKSRQS